MEYPTLELLHKRALEMREVPTPAEKEFASLLKQHGINFYSQMVIAPYIADFVIGKLIIEIDGSVHSKQREYDAKRTKFLKQAGYRVWRVQNKDVSRFDFNRLKSKINPVKLFENTKVIVLPEGVSGRKQKNKKVKWKPLTNKERKKLNRIKQHGLSEYEPKYELVKQPNGDYKRVKVATGKHEPITIKGWR